MTQDNFSLEEETQLPCDIDIKAPEKDRDDVDDDDGDDGDDDCSNSPLPLEVSITAIL